jgi:uncharacterized membrane protein YfcA
MHSPMLAAHHVHHESLWRQFARDQAPMCFVLLMLALGVTYWQHGGIFPGGDRAFAVAGIRVPLWHLFWMGFWTGYLMAIVGEASGIFALPYSMSVLQFTSVSVSPTTLVVTFLDPFGALIGYLREHQLNRDLALWLCLGAVLGSPFGPFLRTHLFHDPVLFKALIGLVLLFLSGHLIVELTPWYLSRTPRQRAFKEKFDRLMAERIAAGEAPSGLPDDFSIDTVERTRFGFTLSYWGQRQTFSIPVMLAIGFGVGICASTLGVGGGFLLVPIMVTIFGLPMHVLVAATIPYVITLSLTGLFSYIVTLPLLTGKTAPPDWGFGLLVASGASLGSWLGSKTQRFIPERYLKSMLAGVTGVVAVLYIVNYFRPLPFKV